MADNKISVSDFVSKVLSLETLESREAYVNTVIKTKYLSYSEKDYWAKTIVNGSSYKRDKDGKPTDEIEMNSNERYFMYILAVVSAYTNIKFSNDSSMYEFDDLIKNGLVEMIFKAIGEDEMERFNTAVENCVEDFRTNHLTGRAYVDAIINRIAGAGDDILSDLGKFLGEMKPEDLTTLLGMFTGGESKSE